MYFLSLEAPGNFVPKKRLRVNVTTVTTIIHFLLDASWVYYALLSSFMLKISKYLAFPGLAM